LLLSQEDPLLGYGYGLSSWTGMTTALNTAFGAGNVTVDTSPLNSLSYMLNYNSLWVTVGGYGTSLTATEVGNIESYEATGRRVVLIGENTLWAAWDNGILGTVGGSYSGVDTSDTLTPVVSDALTAGVPSLTTIDDGIALGGTPLFNKNVATLWGGSQNVLTLLSANVIDDYYGVSPGNQQFKIDLADWLAVPQASASAPDGASTLELLGFGILGIGVCRKLPRCQQRKAVFMKSSLMSANPL
jgi:hypothetical protein